MRINELFQQAIEQNFLDLQILIMFLVYEKQVLTMDRSARELDLCFLDKHNERMNYELKAYKKKMNMNYGLQVFKFYEDNYEMAYILAYSLDQAKFIAVRNNVDYPNVIKVGMDKLIAVDGKEMTFETFTKGKQPSILGGF